MANIKNLTPFNTMEEGRQREIASKGGKASVKARQEKKRLRECLEILLECDTEYEGENTTHIEAISKALMNEALKGNIRAFETIRDTIGQKPVAKVNVSEVDPQVVKEVEEMVNELCDDYNSERTVKN